MSPEPHAGHLYAKARESVSELVRSLNESQLATDVPTCPGWTVRDVVSHLAGVATDAVNGVSGDVFDADWTAQHIKQREGVATNVVLREWERSSSQFEMLLSKDSSTLPAAIMDVMAHEHDIRGAIDRPGNRDDRTLRLAANLLTNRWNGNIESAVLPPLVVGDRSDRVGGASAGQDDVASYQTSAFEMFRASFGRRSVAQMERRFSGVADPQPYIDLLYIFGPAETDIIE
jgi:uncharacterized protein (TIGR03083 family)